MWIQAVLPSETFIGVIVGLAHDIAYCKLENIIDRLFIAF